MITLLWTLSIIIAVLILLCIIRTIIGPRNTDRMLAVNMIGAMVNAVIAALATIYNQNFLADIIILYSMLSFAAVIVMSRIVRGVHHEINAQALNAPGQESEALND